MYVTNRSVNEPKVIGFFGIVSPFARALKVKPRLRVSQKGSHFFPAARYCDRNVPSLKDRVDRNFIDYAFDPLQIPGDIFHNGSLMPPLHVALQIEPAISSGDPD